MIYAPIVLFVYNRPWHTQQTVKALQKNAESIHSDLIIYSDAAKTKEQEQLVLEVREYINSIKGFSSIKVIEQTENKGLADSIITGVTEIVNKYGRIIVLEDDIVTSPFFLKYMNEALEFYKSYVKIMHIASYQVIRSEKISVDTFTMRFMSCWGWGTWKNSWQKFEKDPDSLLEKINNKQEWRDFTELCSVNNKSQVEMNVRNEINTWAVFWAATIYDAGGRCLYPKYSMSKNIGFDGSGVHCSSTSKDKVTLAIKTVAVEKIDSELSFETLYGAYQRKKNKPSILSYMKHFLKISLGR